MNESGLDPDGELLAAAARGDEDAFSVLYRRYLPLVLRWLARESGDREVAADLAAEVFAASLLHASRYRKEDGSVAAWLLGIARNKLRESRRRARVEDTARRRLGLEPIPLTDADLERVEELSSVDEEMTALLEQLPEEQRAALKGRILEERGYPELAAELQCSEMVVRQRVSRGLRALRSQVQGR
jgi:RNA polymerase sigma-70 factor (ECF subfamily)